MGYLLCRWWVDDLSRLPRVGLSEIPGNGVAGGCLCHSTVLQCALLSTDSGLLRQFETDRNQPDLWEYQSCRAKAPASPGFSPGMANHAPNLVV